MMIQREGRPAEPAEDVKVGSFGSERKRSRGKSGFAVEPARPMFAPKRKWVMGSKRKS